MQNNKAAEGADTVLDGDNAATKVSFAFGSFGTSGGEARKNARMADSGRALVPWTAAALPTTPLSARPYGDADDPSGDADDAGTLTRRRRLQFVGLPVPVSVPT